MESADILIINSDKLITVSVYVSEICSIMFLLPCPKNTMYDCELTLLLRQTTGHMEQPRVQQQHRQPNSSQRTLTGRALRRVTFTRVTVACTLGHVSLSTSAANRSIGSTTGCTVTEKAPTRAFSWLKAPTSAFTFKTLC